MVALWLARSSSRAANSIPAAHNKGNSKVKTAAGFQTLIWGNSQQDKNVTTRVVKRVLGRSLSGTKGDPYVFVGHVTTFYSASLFTSHLTPHAPRCHLPSMCAFSLRPVSLHSGKCPKEVCGNSSNGRGRCHVTGERDLPFSRCFCSVFVVISNYSVFRFSHISSSPHPAPHFSACTEPLQLQKCNQSLASNFGQTLKKA